MRISSATPTTVVHGASCSLMCMHLPIGSWPGQSNFAMPSPTTTTGGAIGPSLAANPRPNGPEVVRVACLQNEASELSDRVDPFDKESASFIAPEGNRGDGRDERDARNASRRLDESAPQRVHFGGTELRPAQVDRDDGERTDVVPETHST